ncbi:hypothetical protein BC835DRAFT_120658 [Cytidiella melzeri]|nr:hypothetical protein BC835DRAFT_120658 [Cytidiella melzeri]
MDKPPQWTAQMISTSGPAESITDYSLSHPDARVVAAFFLGGVFMHALHYLFSSNWVRPLLSTLRTAIRKCCLPIRSKNVQVDGENPATLTMSEKGGFLRERSKDEVETSSLRQYNDHRSLIFMLNLCLLLATFALFLTLLAFGAGWDTGCTFVVAWAGMSSQMARLLGMLILIIEITVLLDLKRWTVWAMRGMLIVALIFVFAANATNTGTTGTLQGKHNAFCFRQHFLATSLVSSIIRLLMELYIIVQALISLWSSKRVFDETICASRPLARVLSLLVFDIMTIVPDAIPTNIYAQFIPFSVGAALVLVTFNWARGKSGLATSRTQSIPVFNKIPSTSSPLTVPTPFTLHFPRQYRKCHSWCSDTDHVAPRSTDEVVLSHPASVYSPHSDRSSSQATSDAVIFTANSAVRCSVHQVSLPLASPQKHPTSAPPQSVGFERPAGGLSRKILPYASQAEYAAEMEREQMRLEEEILHMSQPAVPPRPRGELILRDADEISVHARDEGPIFSPNSAFFGSDIIRISARQTRRGTKSSLYPSPVSTQASFIPSPYTSTAMAYRESYDSRMTTRSAWSDNSSAGSSNTSVNAKTKDDQKKTFLSPTSTGSGKSPLRRVNRFSIVSLRNRSHDELSTVREASPDRGARVPISIRVPTGNKRRTFGQSVTTPKRTHRPSSSGTQPSSPIPPVPAIFPTSQGNPAAVTDLSVPSLQVVPATPEPAHIAQSLIPATTLVSGWLSRSIRLSSRPCPQPSAPALSPGLGRGAGWPTSITAVPVGKREVRRVSRTQGFLLSRSSTKRTRSNSCPSVYSVESAPRSTSGGGEKDSMSL